jgi:hypothetical protein
VVGEDPLVRGFFWLAEQQGFGIEEQPRTGVIAADHSERKRRRVRFTRTLTGTDLPCRHPRLGLSRLADHFVYNHIGHFAVAGEQSPKGYSWAALRAASRR